MTRTIDIITALEAWFTENQYNNLVDAIRWLIYNRDDIDVDVCKQWLINHNEKICEPNKYSTVIEKFSEINNINFKEKVRKVNE